MTITIDIQNEYGIAEPVKSTYKTTIRDIYVVVKRNVRRISRTPRLIVFTSIQPIMFLTLFRYVFGGNFHSPDMDYADWLVPGVFVQATLFGGTTAVALSIDLASGMVDRFKSLPISRAAVLAGRTIADSSRNIVVITLLSFVGALMGFNIHNTFSGFVAGIGVVLLFAYCYSWLSAYIGLVAKDPETAQLASFLPLFPFIFASTIFQPVSSFPSWMQGFAEYQPVSVAVTTVRNLIQGGPVANTMWLTLMYCALLVGIFMPLSIRQYRKAA